MILLDIILKGLLVYVHQRCNVIIVHVIQLVNTKVYVFQLICILTKRSGDILCFMTNMLRYVKRTI